MGVTGPFLLRACAEGRIVWRCRVDCIESLFPIKDGENIVTTLYHVTITTTNFPLIYNFKMWL